MSDLARSLIDAAAAVLPAAYAESCGLPERLRDTAGVPEEWRTEAKAAVVAVLETLAAHIANQPVELVDLMGHGIPFNEGKASVVDLMRRLAVEVKSEGR